MRFRSADNYSNLPNAFSYRVAKILFVKKRERKQKRLRTQSAIFGTQDFPFSSYYTRESARVTELKTGQRPTIEIKLASYLWCHPPYDIA